MPKTFPLSPQPDDQRRDETLRRMLATPASKAAKKSQEKAKRSQNSKNKGNRNVSSDA